jgi:hypothetical protein
MIHPTDIVPYFPVRPFFIGTEDNNNFTFADENSFDTKEEALEAFTKLCSKWKFNPDIKLIHVPEKTLNAINENVANYLFVTGRTFFQHLTPSCLVSLMTALNKIYKK